MHTWYRAGTIVKGSRYLCTMCVEVLTITTIETKCISSLFLMNCRIYLQLSLFLYKYVLLKTIILSICVYGGFRRVYTFVCFTTNAFELSVSTKKTNKQKHLIEYILLELSEISSFFVL